MTHPHPYPPLEREGFKRLPPQGEGGDGGGVYDINRILREVCACIDLVDARILLCHSLGISREYLVAHPNRLLSETNAARFNALVARRASGEPIAYIIGTREFYGRQFKVTPDVLILRPETELLVDLALERLPADRPSHVLDLGAGSGAIAITLACERPTAMITAIDASEAALVLAYRNAIALIQQERDSRLTLLKGDWYAPLAGQHFDIIVANPPYVAENDPHLDQGDLRFEPRAALTPGGDGLAALGHIAAGAPRHLRPDGWLICEHGYDQATAVQTLFRAAGLTHIATQPDLAGIPRATLGRLSSKY